MAQEIWKFDLVIGSNHIRMPIGARIISAALQNQDLKIWAQVDPKAATNMRSVRVFGTGWSLPPANDNFVGTIIDGAYVWHVFDMGEVA